MTAFMNDDILVLKVAAGLNADGGLPVVILGPRQRTLMMLPVT